MIGYARVSTTEQNTTLQRDALRNAGVRQIFEEKRSAVRQRPALQQAIAALQPGGVLVVYKIDRLARSLSDLIALLAAIDAKGAGFRSLTEPIDTTSPAGRMTLQILGAFAEFERALIRERSMAGQEAARQRGAAIGRPRALSEADQTEAFRRVQSGESMTSVARSFGVHLSSIKRVWLRRTSPESPGVRRRANEGDSLEYLTRSTLPNPPQ